VDPPDRAIINSDFVRLIWTRTGPDVDRYWLEGDNDSLFSTPFIDSLIVDTVYTVTPLHHNNTFWWRVRAHNEIGWGPFSMTRSFFVYQEIPSAPQLLDPPDGTVGVSTAPVLDWDSSVGAESYALQVSDRPDFSIVVVDQAEIDSTSFRVTDLQNATTYYWRVGAANDLGTSEWSDVWDFTTLATDVETNGQIPAEFSLSQNYPNPFNPSTVISYALPVRSHVKLELFNTLGQRVAVFVDTEKEAGYHSITLESKGFASGLYFYRLEAAAFVMIKKLLLVR
jgi:hypothetical protein